MTKEKYLQHKREMLEDFCVVITEDMMKTIEELYPDELAIERYIKGVLKEHLENFEEIRPTIEVRTSLSM